MNSWPEIACDPCEFQVKCLGKVCGLINFHREDYPDQFYRLWLSLFLHAGWVYLNASIVPHPPNTHPSPTVTHPSAYVSIHCIPQDLPPDSDDRIPILDHEGHGEVGRGFPCGHHLPGCWFRRKSSERHLLAISRGGESHSLTNPAVTWPDDGRSRWCLQVGPAGSQFGILSTLWVEIIQSWPLIKQPWKALGKVIGFTSFLFILGERCQ